MNNKHLKNKKKIINKYGYLTLLIGILCAITNNSIVYSNTLHIINGIIFFIAIVFFNFAAGIDYSLKYKK